MDMKFKAVFDGHSIRWVKSCKIILRLFLCSLIYSMRQYVISSID